MTDLAPGFYDEDIERYKNKFKKNIEQRSLEKIQLRRVYDQNLEGARRPQTGKSENNKKLVRRPSRQSIATYNNVDIDFYGNHNQINHLVKPRVASGTNRTYHTTTR